MANRPPPLGNAPIKPVVIATYGDSTPLSPSMPICH
jgi:hypothetical protein